MRRSAAPSSMAAAAVAKLKARAAGFQHAHEHGHTDLLQRFLEASKDFPVALDTPGIVGMLMSTITGAGDTTATTVVAVLYYLIRHPAALAKLRDELTHLPEKPTPIPKYADVAKLPYLQAVIRESMRLFSTATWPIERLVPEGGATIAGMHFPAGTSVGCLPAAVHLNPGVYGDDVHVFRPERWLTPDSERVRQMEAAHMGFSRGRRVCLGQHIAVLQMKKAIPALVMKFEVS